MLLVINYNNTNVKIGVCDDAGNVVGEWRQQTTSARTADEYAVWLYQLMSMENIDPDKITDAIIATVVPQALFNLRRLCTRYFKCNPFVIGEAGVDFGIEVLATPPVGADRICNAVGAQVMYPGEPVLVVDIGTATTFDVSDEQGNYCGGAIAPGINLSLEALHATTALLPRIIVERPKNVIGTNTVECMHSGVFWGYVGLIESIVNRTVKEFGKPMKVVSTGGLAPVFEGATTVIDENIPDITARGLITIFQRSKAMYGAPEGSGG